MVFQLVFLCVSLFRHDAYCPSATFRPRTKHPIHKHHAAMHHRSCYRRKTAEAGAGLGIGTWMEEEEEPEYLQRRPRLRSRHHRLQPPRRTKLPRQQKLNRCPAILQVVDFCCWIVIRRWLVLACVSAVWYRQPVGRSTFREHLLGFGWLAAAIGHPLHYL